MGTAATASTVAVAGKSSSRFCRDKGKVPPQARLLSGRISERSMIFAPTILPTHKAASPFLMAVKVVTSSGRLVPTASSVTAMIRSGTPKYAASPLPPLTSK